MDKTEGQQMDIGSLEEVENVYIPMADGIRLGARLFIPQDRPVGGLPALLEYIPIASAI